jgi:hypothetical protein
MEKEQKRHVANRALSRHGRDFERVAKLVRFDNWTIRRPATHPF